MPFKSKRKITTNTRSAFWPCGSCRQNCSSKSILCDSCNRWYHATCEMLSVDEFEAFQSCDVSYTCWSCFHEDVGTDVNYAYALSRMMQSARHHKPGLIRFAARREQERLEPFRYFGGSIISSNFIEVDNNAKRIMETCGLSHYGIPGLSTGDGNCLFNSISIALCGTEDLATELRVRAAIEMALNQELHKNREDNEELLLFSPPVEESLEKCCIDGEYSSVWTIMALASVIGRPIQSVYPCMNGPSDKAVSTLTKLFCYSDNQEREPIAVLWCKLGPNLQLTWTPNHFVPIFKMDDTSLTASAFQPACESTPKLSMKRKGSFKMTDMDGNTVKISKVDNLSPTNDFAKTEDDKFVCVDENMEKQTEICEEEPRTHAGNMSSGDIEDETLTAETFEHLPDPANVGKFHHRHWHSAEDMFKLVTEKGYVHNEVPPGDKSNKFMLVDNTRNVERIKNSKKCEYFDDCGIWDSTKGKTVKTYYVKENDGLKNVELKKSIFSIKKRNKGTTSWVALNPQPAESSVYVLHRYYATHKVNINFQKRVSYFMNTADTSITATALYEYIGEQPKLGAAHGNANKQTNGFTRTHPQTMDKISTSKSTKPREQYMKFKQEDSMRCTRDMKVIRNKRYNENKKSDHAAVTVHNIADELLNVFGMVNEHPFVQTVIHNKDQVPSIICYTKEQIHDLRYLLSAKENTPIGIDRTFNLGDFYVTILVYKNNRVCRKGTNEHPIFLGPVLLHKDCSYKTYKTFLENIATEIDKDIALLEVRLSSQLEFGSDDEKALTKAIDHVYPSAKRLLCTKHLKDNVRYYLQNKVGVNRNDREAIMESIFGSNGLINADDTFAFDSKAELLTDDFEKQCPQFKSYFDSNLKDRIFNYVFLPARQDSKNKQWTNNNTESMNNILKISVDWKPQNTEELIWKIYGVTRLHFMDYRSALHDSGNYELAANQRHYRVPDSVWRCKDEGDKVKLFNNFLLDKKRKLKEKYVTSSKSKFSVINKLKGPAKKPGQRKRPRNERTNYK